jgi:hypothetical protein
LPAKLLFSQGKRKEAMAQAQRRLDTSDYADQADQGSADPVSSGTTAERETPLAELTERSTRSNAAHSPARDLQDELSQWAAGGAVPQSIARDDRLPVMQRLVIITGISLALWASIIAGVASILPG